MARNLTLHAVIKSKHILWAILFFLLTPLWMRLLWEFTPEKKLDLLIVDKTVLNKSSVKHRAINWILDHERIVKSNGDAYEIGRDYYGFFPGENTQYTIRDFDTMSREELDSIADYYDMIYYADSYGIFSNDWYRHRDRSEVSHNIYGGMSEKDLELLGKLKDRKKLIIAEFNSVAKPTPVDIRLAFERMFGIRYTGWMARSITSLDTLNNPDLPSWIVTKVRSQNNGQWNYAGRGILFVHQDGEVIVLQEGKDLVSYLPVLAVDEANQKRYNVPGSTIHPDWIDIWQNISDENNIAGRFIINTTGRGDEILRAHGLPNVYPAIISHESDYKFLYFCGDFAQNPTKFRFAQLKGITSLKFLMYNVKDDTDRNLFFWEFYLPFLQSVFKEQLLLVKPDTIKSKK